MDSIFILIINALLYTFLALKQYKKSNKINIGVFILAWFALVAWAGMLYYSQDLFKYFNPYAKISFAPFIYLFIAIYLFIYPLLRFNSSQIQKMQLINDNYLYKYILFMLAIEILTYISIAPIIIKVLTSNASVAFRENSYDSIGGGISINNFFLSKIATIGGVFTAVNIIVSIYALLFSKLSKKLRIIFFLSSALIPPFIKTSLGNRFFMMSELTWILFILILLANFIKPNLKKKIILSFIIASSLALIFFTIISLGRFGNMFEYQLFRYIGEPFVNYNTQFFYELNDNTWGRAYFTTFRKWLGYPTEFETLVEKWQFLDDITGVDTHVFYTFIGGFNIEFGFVFTLIIAASIALIYNRLIKPTNILTLPKLIILCYLGYICIQGAFLFPIQGAQNIELLTVIISYISFRKISIKKYQNSNLSPNEQYNKDKI